MPLLIQSIHTYQYYTQKFIALEGS